MKRGVDVVLAATVLIVTAPLMLTIALAVRVVDGSPVSFRQMRSGRDGQPFAFVKFRTMRPPNEAQRGPDHDDQRLTRLGRWLRATSLDELPTLFHVLRGEMSIVGPRPLPIEYLDRYDNTQARRLEARPGVTGWAQVNGRNLVPWTERFELDVWYVDHASTRLDLRILRATIRQVIRREGIDQGDGTTMTEFTGTS
ncbi:MAG: lipopolysaccharide/colanic/teichoic acid biosynthesis glycosyltransferase [Ilumatobacter sp.]|jgi:sugar transferase EpsL